MAEIYFERYFEIKPGTELYKEYFEHKNAIPKILKAWQQIRERFEIQTNDFYLTKNCLWIITPTETDCKKFASMFRKGQEGKFKLNTKPCKAWISLVKEIDYFYQVDLRKYFAFNYEACCRFHLSHQLFDVDNHLYCYLGGDGCLLEPDSDMVIEMKSSEFHRIREEENERRNRLAEENDTTEDPDIEDIK